MSGHNWAFSQLAPSPGTTPANGAARDRSDETLSFPCDSNALQAQLEAWTNVAFEFDSPDFADAAALDEVKPAAAPSPAADERNRYAARVGEFGFKPLLAVHDEPASSVDLSALLGTAGAASGSAADPFAPSNLTSGSLVDPALSLPSFAAVAPALPPSFFAPETPAAAAGLELASPAYDAPSPATTTASGKKSKGSAAAAAAASVAASKKKRSPSAAVAAKLANAAKTLPLPDGVDPSSLKEDELNRLAIEEDKRRRNTAASARFRVKKKQREQALEQTAKELKERVAILEKEVDTLRTENGWLRSLVVDKSVNTGRSGADNTRKRAREDETEHSLDPSSILV
ncbi:hypothetical protein JCM3770_002835 [Rhodotorula araucariae]